MKCAHSLSVSGLWLNCLTTALCTNLFHPTRDFAVVVLKLTSWCLPLPVSTLTAHFPQQVIEQPLSGFSDIL